jgi:hypothetical protein
MNDRAAHRAAVEAGYADLASYVAKYRDEPARPSLHGDGHVGPVAETRDKAFEEFDKSGKSNAPEFDPGAARRAFNAGWAARKQAEYEAALKLSSLRPRPLHSSAYEPLKPWRPS